MAKVLSLTNLNEKNLNAEAGLDYQKREEIVNSLVEQGLPTVFNPNNFINRIAQNYGISVEDARECLKEAIDGLEQTKTQKTQEQPKEQEEKLYAQSGYFYPQKTMQPIKSERDGMDSLVAYASFQRLKFGL